MTHNWSPTSIGRNTFERSVSPRTSGIPQTGHDTKPETALFFCGCVLRKTKVLKYESAAIMTITATPISTYSIFSFVMNTETGDATTEAPYKRALSSQRMQSRKKRLSVPPCILFRARTGYQKRMRQFFNPAAKRMPFVKPMVFARRINPLQDLIIHLERRFLIQSGR